ncbi:MAG: aldo/keto reductase [Pseudomonadota bacterium]
MDQRIIASTNISVSPLGLGTVKFGRNESVKYPEGFELPSDEQIVELLTLAQHLGINMLDTAPAYGLSETRLGRLMPGKRSDWVIIGKAGEEFRDGQSYFDFTAARVEMSVERSLERLNTNYLDALLLHSDGRDVEILSDDILIQKLHDLKTQGLVKAIGASTKTVEGGKMALDLLDTAMVTYNPEHTEELPVLDYALEQGKSVLLKKVFSSGHNASPEECLKLALSHPAVASAIVGTINPKHLTDNVTAAKNLL